MDGGLFGIADYDFGSNFPIFYLFGRQRSELAQIGLNSTETSKVSLLWIFGFSGVLITISALISWFFSSLGNESQNWPTLV